MAIDLPSPNEHQDVVFQDNAFVLAGVLRYVSEIACHNQALWALCLCCTPYISCARALAALVLSHPFDIG
jgi:hypothetical protein